MKEKAPPGKECSRQESFLWKIQYSILSGSFCLQEASPIIMSHFPARIGTGWIWDCAAGFLDWKDSP